MDQIMIWNEWPSQHTDVPNEVYGCIPGKVKIYKKHKKEEVRNIQESFSQLLDESAQHNKEKYEYKQTCKHQTTIQITPSIMNKMI